MLMQSCNHERPCMMALSHKQSPFNSALQMHVDVWHINFSSCFPQKPESSISCLDFQDLPVTLLMAGNLTLCLAALDEIPFNGFLPSLSQLRGVCRWIAIVMGFMRAVGVESIWDSFWD